MSKKDELISKLEDKKCSKCGIIKPYSEFYKYNRNSDGLLSWCIGCDIKRGMIWYNKNKDNPNWINDKNKKSKEYYENNKQKILIQKREYFIRNVDQIVKQKKEYTNIKKQEDPIYKVLLNLRTRTSIYFKKISNGKDVKTMDLLGIDLNILKIYIEKKFKKNMTWNNYGEWHIDHIMPLSSAKTKDDLINLCHFTNLQPLWKSENSSKKNKIIEHQRKLTI